MCLFYFIGLCMLVWGCRYVYVYARVHTHTLPVCGGQKSFLRVVPQELSTLILRQSLTGT